MSELQTSAQPGEDPRSEWEKSVEMRFRIGDTQIGRSRHDIKELRAELKVNSEITEAMRIELKANSEITGEIRDIVMAFAAFARFCKRVGNAIAWIGRRVATLGRILFRVLKVGAAVAASIGTIWAFIWAAMHGLPPGEIHEGLPAHEQPPQGRSIERPFSFTRK